MGNYNIIASNKNWIEGEAINQLKKTAELNGMIKCSGMPDLHPGKGNPIGAAFISKDIFYPYLVGNDIGCGMSFFETDFLIKKFKSDKWLKKLAELDIDENQDFSDLLEKYNIEKTDFDSSLGTIGGGNHFAEFQTINNIIDEEEFNKLNISKKNIFLLVHSGSRGYGESILRGYVDKFLSNGITLENEYSHIYLKKHDNAIKWAKLNRFLIAKKFSNCIGFESTQISDICHNHVTKISYKGCDCFLHRKGATPAEGITIIPGSRGSFSYLVKTIGNQEENCFSLAHGAGRKYSRKEMKERLEKRFTVDSLTKTDLGSFVICEDKNLLYEEAPQAYKNIDIVVNDMVDFGLIKIIAILKPIITYKTKRK
ncbi:MAG: RNA ligase RtcB family protein [Candidatus Sericytochromatia bacterium]